MTDLLPLTQEQRQDAQQAARDAVLRDIGDRPRRDEFSDHAVSEYPPAVTRGIIVLCGVLLAAAFTPSAIRLYTIGSETFGKTIDSTIAMHLVGLATVLSAETGQVVFSLALATLGKSRRSTALLYTSMMIATLIALVGNIQVALPGHVTSPFAWFEAIAPPLLVLSTAYVLKEQILHAVQRRHANEQAFQDALAGWLAATADPEKHSRWSQFYANAIRDQLRKRNSRRKDTLEDMTTADWRAVVYRELQAESWYAPPVLESPVYEENPMVLAAARSNGNGHYG